MAFVAVFAFWLAFFMLARRIVRRLSDASSKAYYYGRDAELAWR